MKEVAVVILNWNGLEFLKQFLPSVVLHSSDEADIWIVDNASDDSSIEWVKSTYSSINLLINSENFGFAKGYNEGLKHIESKYYVLLNSDVEVAENWISPVIDFMKRKNITVCQPKILDQKRKTHFEHAGAAGGFIDKNGFIFCRGRIFNEIESDKGQYDESGEVFWASGASLFVTAQAYHEIGGLDEDFFAHMEEIDLCWRMKNAGHRIGYCHQSKIYHVGGGTLDSVNPYKTYLNFRNNLYMLVKNYRQGPLLPKIIWRMLLDGVAAFRFLIEGKPSYFLSVVKAHFSFYFSFALMLRKRRKGEFAVSQSNQTGFYNRSILSDFFFHKKRKYSDLDPTAFL